MTRTSYIRRGVNDIRFVLDLHPYLNYFIVVAHWNNILRVDMSLHSGHIILIRANKSLVLRSVAWVAEKQHIPIV
jgi:hypothetical protein